MKSKNPKGMRYPALNDLIKRANNKYELVIATAKRAREIIDGKDPLVPVTINNPISIATEEIAEDLVKLENPVLEEKEKHKTEESNIDINGFTVNTLDFVDDEESEN